jgi:hypothetical protein
MSARDYVGLALVVVGSVFALGLAFGFLMGLRGRREGAEDPSRVRRGDAPGRDDGRRNSAGIYPRPWRSP